MALNFNGTEIGAVNFNGTEVNKVTYNGTTVWEAVNITSLQEASWSDIDKISRAGRASQYFSIGDEKTVIVAGEGSVTLVILGFDHDDLADGSGQRAGITFGMKNLLYDVYMMNPELSNVGSWSACDMRINRMKKLKSGLPGACEAVLKQVNKRTSSGDDPGILDITKDFLFLLSEIEVTGGRYSSIVEGKQYAYYKDIANTADLRAKRLSDGSGALAYWWLRSPVEGSSDRFYAMNTRGAAVENRATYERGVSFAFCV